MDDTDPALSAAHAARMIGSLGSWGEADGYEAEAKRRGIAAHEVRLLAERRQALIRKGRGPGAQIATHDEVGQKKRFWK